MCRKLQESLFRKGEWGPSRKAAISFGLDSNERAHLNDVTKELGYGDVNNIQTCACSISEIYKGEGLLAESETAR